MAKKKPPQPAANLWYKDAVIYQLHIRAFYDSNGDGIGDFKGLLQKLDYLHDLGVTAIWILPFYPSPLKDDGYDIADYTTINPSYGDLNDFRSFLDAAHERGMRVITEMVINHTSDQHEWFQKSRRAEPGSYWRDFYVWSDDPQKYKEVRIIFKDFEASNWTYDNVAKSYFWHRFYSHQPDLNFDNPEVKKKLLELVDYWMDMGVDGMRLDAIPYLYEREGTSCENLPETHVFLKELRAYVEERYPDAMLLAEANQWPEDAVEYFGDGDECHMCFHFPLMPRLFMAVKTEDRFSVIDILQQTPEIPENCQWATFLRNHDELTLEMVTDEERDYMYNVYAAEPRARINLGIRRRLAPLLENDRRQIELLKSLLFAMPGTPIIYYGDEIGMGDNIYLGDRNGVRTPFQWSPDRNAGFSKADPQKLFLPVITAPEYHYETVNVDTQRSSPNSLWRWTKTLIEMRKSSAALTRGSLKFLEPKNRKVLTFVREHDVEGRKETVLVVANLSRTAQYVELDLKEYKDLIPVEMRGQTSFPAIGKGEYTITLGPYDCYWFSLVTPGKLEVSEWLLHDKRNIGVSTKPLAILNDLKSREYLEKLIAAYLPKASWFRRVRIERLRISDVISIPHEDDANSSVIVFVDVFSKDKKETPDTYLVTISYAEGDRARDIMRDRPDLVIGEYEYAGGKKGIYHEAIIDGGFAKALLLHILGGRKIAGENYLLEGKTYRQIDSQILQKPPPPYFMGAEKSNSSLRFGEQYYCKLYRRIQEGINPEIEVGEFFSKTGFTHTPPLVGSLTYKSGGKIYSLGIIQEYTPGGISAWDMLLDQLGRFSEAALAEKPSETQKVLDKQTGLFDLQNQDLPVWFVEQSAYTATLLQLMGTRTGEMHLNLSTDTQDAAFTPENFTPFYQRSLFQSLHNRQNQARMDLQADGNTFSVAQKSLIDNLYKNWPSIENVFGNAKKSFFDGMRIRVHGNYHLGEVIFTGNDFQILDFEGESQRTISSRRLKHSPLKDVAALLRSLDYLVFFFDREKAMSDRDRERLTPALKLWRLWMYGQFMTGYLQATANSNLLPADQEHVRRLTEIFLLDKALAEISYELRHRPEWLDIPLRGITDLLPILDPKVKK